MYVNAREDHPKSNRDKKRDRSRVVQSDGLVRLRDLVIPILKSTGIVLDVVLVG